MTEAKFWGAAIMQGGGLGIFGDFLGQDMSRSGSSLAATFAGAQFGAYLSVQAKSKLILSLLSLALFGLGLRLVFNA